MKSLIHKRLQILSGVNTVFEQFPDGEMWKGNGTRDECLVVNFEKPFAEPPQVHFGIVGLNTGASADVRLNITVPEGSISRDQFVIHAGTWGDSKTCYLKVSWMAVGTPDREPDAV